MAYLNKKARIGLITAALLSMSLLSSCGNDGFMLDVLAIGEGGAEITGEYHKQVEYGGKATFEVSVPEGETVVQVFSDDKLTTDYSYENGILTINSVTVPQTLLVVSGNQDEKIYWGVESSNTKYGGNVKTNVEQGRTPKGSMITVSAAPLDGAKFIGWSRKQLIDKGGELVSDKEQYTFELAESTFLYANYDISELDIPENKPAQEQKPSQGSGLTVYYNNNGGDVMEGNKAAVQTSFNSNFWLMPFALQDDGRFTKEGSVLLGYSFENDGTGELIRPGYKYHSTDKNMTLYCIWADETDPSSFTYSAVGKGIKLDSYNGNDKVIYIPREIDGKPVTQIGGECFKGNNNIEEVHITSSITSIDDGAFANCPKLTTVTLYDNLSKVGDACFEGSPISNIRFCAATAPRNITNGWTFGKKYERLAVDTGKPRVIIVSGSSQFYGLDSDHLEKLLDNKYTVVNYGTHAGANILFSLEAITDYIKEGDILLYTPEQYGKNTYHTSGNPEFTETTFSSFEGSYNLFEHFDASKYTNIFDSLEIYVQNRNKLKDVKWDARVDGIDQYADYTYIRKNLNSNDYHHNNNGEFHFDDTVIPDEFVMNINRVLDKAQETGATVLFGHPSYNYNAVLPEFQDNEEAYDNYNKYLEDTIHARLISDVRDYIYEGKYFADTDYHLNMIGRPIHTENIAEDLKAAGVLKE